ncbi:MAG: hypothetical protein A2792_09905 [Sphingomonadales bacterium RIFCSPHIGHO2_01_FULL_65_20]|uniref:hypothetical protein n=1 Tax=Blastomonas sp. TaxID=1909299 RepID=UPI0008BBD618|nr:hypothetical protein [Blastomonas sp.]OHC97739.1 MAG: hypothetical protein A2792_09905 [Sphingomonadales bacterium RIFCSPHIGHO2_01_FULL_65_20]
MNIQARELACQHGLSFRDEIVKPEILGAWLVDSRSALVVRIRDSQGAVVDITVSARALEDRAT